MYYVFESERLGFRRWKEEDKVPFAFMNGSSKVMNYFPYKLTREQSDAMMVRIEEHFQSHGYGLWAVDIKETGQFIGFIGFSHPGFEADFTPCIEIGWRLDEKYWKKGYAQEGAKACLKYGNEVLGIHEVYSFTSLWNEPSYKVMERIGMTKVGEFDHPKLDEDDPLRPHVLYRIELD